MTVINRGHNIKSEPVGVDPGDVTRHGKSALTSPPQMGQRGNASSNPFYKNTPGALEPGCMGSCND